MGDHSNGRCRGNIDPSIVTVVGVLFKSMDSFEDRHCQFLRRMLSFLGFWRTQTHKERLLRYYVIGSVFLYSLPAQLCQFFTLDRDLQSVAFTLQIFIASACFAVAYYTCILHFMTIQIICRYIKQDLQRLTDNNEQKIMERHIYESKLFTFITGCTNKAILQRVTLCYYIYKTQLDKIKHYYNYYKTINNILHVFMISVICFLYLILFMLPPVLRKILSTDEGTGSIDRFPIFTCLDYFLDRETYYYPTLIYQAVMLIVGTMTAISCYSTYFSFTQHICARLSIIGHKINQPFRNNSLNNNSLNNNSLASPIDLSHWIIDIIQWHARTKEFINMVNNLSEKSYFFQMLLAFVLITVNFLCMLQIPVLLEHKESRNDMIAFVVFVFNTLFPVYVNCFVGQRLIDYSEDVYKEACLIPIHAISLKTQKLLLTMLMMNAEPYTISIGKIFIASHGFFSNLVRMAWSFAVVLNSL